MTKKHFIAFAKIINQQLVADKLCKPKAQAMADMIIAVASQDNPAFDEKRFLKACGLE